MSLEVLFDKMWEQYSQLNPQAKEIHSLLEKTGNKISNDHVAYRAVNLPGFGIETLKAPLISKGYKICGEYKFELKKLKAIHLEHEDSTLPKVFISELLLEELSPKAQASYKSLLEGVVLPEGEDVLTCGRLWDVDFQTYQELYKESEYAAWLSAFGYCANHFTINVNDLADFNDLTELNTFLEENGYILNASGGKVKGSKEVYLEQSSTMAGELAVSFSDGEKKVPSCYYEFALRHKMENGGLFSGFVAGSADKIFESTNKI